MEARYKPIKLILLFLPSLAVFAGMVWMLSSESSSTTAEPYDWAMPWALWVTALFFGTVTLVSGYSIFDRRPQLCIGLNGVFWRNPWGQKRFAWSQIASVHVKRIGRYGSGELLVLTLRDGTHESRRGIRAFFAKINRASGFGDVKIGITGFDRSAEDILAVARHYVNKGG